MQNKRITQCAGYQTRERGEWENGRERVSGKTFPQVAGSGPNSGKLNRCRKKTELVLTGPGKKFSAAEKVTISHPEYVGRFLSSFWTLRVLRLEKFHNIEYNTNINHVCLLFYAHHTFMFLSVLLYTRYTTHLNLLFSDSLWSSLQSLQFWSLFVYVFSVVFVGCLFVFVLIYL